MFFRTFFGLAATLLLFSCTRPEAGLHVVVEGPLTPGTDFDRLSLVAYLAADRTPLHLEAIEGEELRLPATFNLVSGPGTPAGTEVEVLASAERAGTVVSSVRGTSTLQPGTGGQLTLTLPPVASGPTVEVAEICDDRIDDDGDGLVDCGDPDCEGQTCAPRGLTCSMGACGCGGSPVGRYTQALEGVLPRAHAQSVLVTSGGRAGWVAIVGGESESGVTGAVELVQPVSGQLESTALGVARLDATLLSLSDGNLMVLGGETASGAAEPTYELLSAATLSTPAAKGALTPMRGVVGASAFEWNGALLVSGGSLGTEVLRVSVPAQRGAAIEVETFAKLAEPHAPGVLFEGGRVFFAGGPQFTAMTELLETDGGVSTGPLLTRELRGCAVAPLPGGRALIVGGEAALEDGGTSPLADAFVVAAQGQTVGVRQISSMGTAMSMPRALPLGNGWVYVEDARTGKAEWFDPASERFVPAPAPSGAVDGASLAAMQSGVVRSGGLVDGGYNDVVTVLDLRCP